NKAIKEENAPVEMLCGMDEQMEKRGDGGLYYMDRIWVPLIGDIRTMIMDEAHATRYSIHPGADKMYYDLRDMYRWPGMKRDIATYEKITMDFITKLLRSSGSMEKLLRLYIDEIVAKRGVPVLIIFDRDERFTSVLAIVTESLSNAVGYEFLALGWLLEEIHVTWAHLENKRTRLRTYTKSLEDLCK
nr:hypothetical protein [Tanacetum cinerariifolium]GEX69859.1 hypothetical protein [Tanacetum cinerariifolium]